jgi:hypothetical protein
MDITRREFVGYGIAAGAMGVGLRLPSSTHLPARTHYPCIVSPVQGQCSLPESVKGYCSALRPTAVTRRETWIVPAVVDIPSPIGKKLVEFLHRGWTIIVESGGGFAGHLNFRRHRRALRERLHVDVQAPVALWTDDSRSRRTPYVDYTWPSSAKVRDFSRVVPVGDQPGKIIARIDGLPVALKRQVGAGTLIFLGSPLGPALWAGDSEAKRWLLALLA